MSGMEWRRFIVPKKVEQINYHLFIDTYKSNNIKKMSMLNRWSTFTKFESEVIPDRET